MQIDGSRLAYVENIILQLGQSIVFFVLQFLKYIFCKIELLKRKLKERR